MVTSSFRLYALGRIWVVSLLMILLHSTSWAAPNPRYGVVASNLDSFGGAKATELGVGAVRLDFYWYQMQTQRGGAINWADTDRWVNEATSRNLVILASISGTPSWSNSGGTTSLPQMSDWQAFVAAVIQRYQQYDNIVFGVWNEPNLNEFLNQGTPAKYAQLYDYADRARDSVKPGARLAGPETSGAGGRTFSTASALSAIAPYMHSTDVVTVHWYSGDGELVSYLAGVKSAGGGRELWLSETGRATCDDAAQRDFVQSMLSTFELSQASAVFLHVLWAPAANCATNEYIVRPDGSNRPAFTYYRDYLTGRQSRPAALSPGQSLWPDQCAFSSNTAYAICYQGDGNFVYYKTATWSPIWSTDTFQAPGRVVMQGDGNLVMYGAGGQYIWDSGTGQHPGAYVFVSDVGSSGFGVVDSTGLDVLWGRKEYVPGGGDPPVGGIPVSLASGQYIWSDTCLQSPNASYRLCYQGDGNLVLYNAAWSPLWASNTAGTGAGVLSMQGDGNLVIYDPSSYPVWASGTAGNGGAYLAVTNDGHCSVIASDGVQVLWSR